MVWIDPKANIHVNGTAKADFVRPGLFVKFTAEVDKRGKAQDKVEELTIFTPSQQDIPGFWPEGTGPAAPEEGDGVGDFRPVIPPQMSTGRYLTPGKYAVAGRITADRKGKFTLTTARRIFQFELAEEPKIEVDFADYSVAQQGDQISVKKGKMFAGRMGMAQASELAIKLSEPLTFRVEKPVRTKKATAKRPSRQPGKETPTDEAGQVEPQQP
jgi:hypothetical protein